jgi:hypothetical protein
VVVFLLLLSSGAGSLASNRWLAGTHEPRVPLILITGAALIYVAFLPGLLNVLVGIAFPVKLLVSAGLLVPLGFAMGMPFPTGLRAIATFPTVEFAESVANENAVEWAWAMNAGASVLGSVLAMVLAIGFGLNITLACGAAAYLLATLISRTLQVRVAG